MISLFHDKIFVIDENEELKWGCLSYDNLLEEHPYNIIYMYNTLFTFIYYNLDLQPPRN